LTVGVTSVNVYQQNMRGGTSTKNKRGRFNGNYSLEVAADFERLFGLEGIGFYTSAEGAWPKSGDNYRDDTGVYVSCDQMIRKENDDAEDSQGIGAFFRWGYANSDLNEIGNFWSFGFQYQGLVEGRDDVEPDLAVHRRSRRNQGRI